MANSGITRNEVAVFIDLENLRYSLLNIYGQEPDFGALVDKAKKYGRPSIMRAYADFSEHPPELTRQLQVVGVEAINVPVKRLQYIRGAKQIERVKNAADMVMAIDAINEAADADSVGKSKVFFLVTGDADYIRLVTQLKNRFGQQVVIAGVPGSMGTDLITAAGQSDPIDVKTYTPIDPMTLKTAIIKMVKKGPSPLKFWSFKVLDQWCQNPKHNIPGVAKEKRDAIRELMNEGVLIRQELDLATFGKKGLVTQTILDESKAKGIGYLS